MSIGREGNNSFAGEALKKFSAYLPKILPLDQSPHPPLAGTA